MNAVLAKALLIAQQIAAVIAVALSVTNLWALFPSDYRGWVIAAGTVDLVVERIITALQSTEKPLTITLKRQ